MKKPKIKELEIKDLNACSVVILVGSEDFVLSTNYSIDYYKTTEYPNNIRKFNKNKLQYSKGEFSKKKVIELNTIEALNIYLKRIIYLYEKEVETKGETDFICNIVLEHVLYDKITRGTYVYWINKGRTLNAKLTDKEIKTWKNFSELYEKALSYVTFESANYYRGDIKKEYKYKTHKDRQDMITSKIKMLDFLEKTKEEYENKIFDEEAKKLIRG